MNSFLGSVAMALQKALQPLAQAFYTPETLQSFLRRFGWAVDKVDSASLPAIRAGFALADLFKTVEQLATQLESASPDDELGIAAKLIEALHPIIDAVRALATSSPSGLPFPFDQADFWKEVPLEIVDEIVADYLEDELPIAYGVMVLLGLAEDERINPATPGRAPYRRRTIRWDRLGTVFSAPQDLFKDVYHWNDPAQPLDHQRLLSSLERFFWTLNVPARDRPPPAALLGHYFTPDNPALQSIRELRVPIATAGGPDQDEYAAVGLSILPIPASAPSATPPVGYLLSPFVTGSLVDDPGATDDDPDGRTAIFLDVGGGFDVDGAFGLEVRPDSVGLEVGAGSLDAKIGVGARPATPWILVGAAGSHRIELGGFQANVGVRGEITDLEFVVEAGTGTGSNPPKLRLVIQTTDADGFLHRIFGNNPQSVDFTGMFGWSSKTGFHFTGSAGFTFTIALDLSVEGVLNFKTLTIALTASGSGAALTAGLTIEASIGPIDATVQDIGAKLALVPSAPGTKGTFGDLDLQFSFKPPTGLGINISAGPITGGGFIEFDPDNGRYAGVLALSLYSIQIKAIGLLDTKLPNGESGYSFLVIISVEFTPIQLGFGFTLNGVGGLCGINRDFVTDAIQAGLRAHSIDHILFPKDPIKNAPAIISDLRAIFPPAEGRYVFGPMLELGWGGGLNLVTAELGVILAIPSPVIIAILGQLNVNVPSPDAAVIELHLDVLGIIDFGKKLFSLDATLHDSRIVIFTIFGDMAMRLSWGDNPSFALSIGGLNPHFQPPDGFPQLKRLTIALSASDEFRLSIQTYFAITSNSFQFGAHAELYIGVSAFNVYGWLGFDALFIFKPFSFIVDFTAGLALRSGTSTLLGISLDGELSGPKPWHAVGNAHVTLLFFEISCHVDITWGDSGGQTDLPEVDAWPQLQAAIVNVQNWSGGLPSGVPAPVTLSTPKADDTTIYVDPSGVLTMRERVLPLDQPLTKFGEAVPGPQAEFDLVSNLSDPSKHSVLLGGAPVPFSIVRDKFAPAQFEQMSDQDKLSRPSFEDRDAGFSVGDGQLDFGGVQLGLDVAFEDIYVDDHAPPPATTTVRFNPTLIQQIAWANTNGAASSALRAAALGKFGPPASAKPLVALGDEHYVVASTNDLSQRPDITHPVTKGEAFQALSAHLAKNPGERGQLQVVPLYELAA